MKRELRIIIDPSFNNRYVVERRRFIFFWRHISLFPTLESAEAFIRDYRRVVKVIKQ